jgi:hypothetical protein
VGALCSFVGVALSRHILTVYGFGLSTAGIVVVLIGLVFGIALLKKTTLRTQRTQEGKSLKGSGVECGDFV